MSTRSIVQRQRRLLDDVVADLAGAERAVPRISAAAIRLGRARAAADLARRELGEALALALDPVIEHGPDPLAARRAAALADPDAVLAGIGPLVMAVSSSAMRLRFGLRDTAADNALLRDLLAARGWTSHVAEWPGSLTFWHPPHRARGDAAASRAVPA